MRRRERAYALALGTICTLALLGGAWPLPLLAFATLELLVSGLELAAATSARRGERGSRARRRYRAEAAGGILRGTP